MCMTIVDSRPKVPDNLHVGWKAFFKYTKSKNIYGVYIRKIIPIGHWIKEEDFRPSKKQGSLGNPLAGLYKTGFHIFYSEKKARKLYQSQYNIVIKKVYFRKPVASGWNFNAKTIVAKEMWVCDHYLDKPRSIL